jgi:hypothetical protein
MGASYGPVGTYSYCSSIISCHSFVPCGAQCKTTRKMRRPKELLLRCTQPRTAREDHRIDADATEHPCLRCTYGTRCCNSDRRQWKRRDDVRAYVARSHPLQVHGHSTWSTPTYAHPPTTVRSTTDPSRPRLREHAQDAQGTARRRKRAWGHAGAFGFTFIARQRRGLIITVAGGSCMRDCRRPPGPAKEGIGDRRGFELRGHGLMGLRRTAHRRRRGSCGSPLALGEVAVAPERAPPPLATYVSLQRQNNNLSLKTASWSACMQKKNRIDDISHIQH